ncbi:bacillithiol system redox-active protein YtxJ [Paenibacillus apiarius]|uniref:bacillithiol system redox-active protein YtxJ n=1 Tax=Paenibacillus apiarius TaxID=46240 RepID=UPI00197EDE42|nr:bacillithiol system redox-active protein YtxJ [Paenibacillus apiarius]MBN3526030.1 bacillithiol system redox-active protein YtxJ [Paenibacillus apiarius]
MKAVDSIENLQEAIDLSSQQTVVLFKHSTRCPISAQADEEMVKVEDDYEHKGVGFGRILVVEHRDVAQACAEQLGIKHESPQVLVLKNGKVAWHDSHYAIRYDKLESVLTM